MTVYGSCHFEGSKSAASHSDHCVVICDESNLSSSVIHRGNHHKATQPINSQPGLLNKCIYRCSEQSLCDDTFPTVRIYEYEFLDACSCRDQSWVPASTLIRGSLQENCSHQDHWDPRWRGYEHTHTLIYSQHTSLSMCFRMLRNQASQSLIEHAPNPAVHHLIKLLFIYEEMTPNGSSVLLLICCSVYSHPDEVFYEPGR